MLPGKRYTPDEIVRLLARRKWMIVFPTVIGLAAGVIASSRVVEKYRSETLIMVVPQRIPQEYVRATNTETVADRLNSINDVILSRSRLERIIRDLDLYANLRVDGAIMEDVVQRMRSDIGVNIEGRESFRVSYVSSQAKTAQTVTDRLASLYIEENLRDQEKQAESTNQFLESQLEDAKRRLLEQEKKLEEYKSRHAGELPSQQQSNLQAIQSTQLQLQSISESTNRTRERRILIERQLADTQSMPIPTGQSDGAQPLPDASSSLTTAQQVEAAQSRLESYKLRYTPNHPDIRALERTIADLQKRLTEEAREPKPVVAKPLSLAESMRQRKISELQAQLEAFDHQIATNQAEEQRLKSSIAAYQTRLNAGPARESELVELTRDYSTLNDAYMSLLKKREDSKMAENLVRRQVGEQFRVLDAASYPEKPFNSKQRLAFIAGGVVGGLLLGLGLLGFLEYRDSTLKTDDEVLRLITVPVLAVIPVLAAQRDRQHLLFRKRLFDVAGTAVVVVIVAAVIIWRWRP